MVFLQFFFQYASKPNFVTLSIPSKLVLYLHLHENAVEALFVSLPYSKPHIIHSSIRKSIDCMLKERL